MTTKAEAILTAVIGVIGVTTPAGIRVYRNRDIDIPRADLPYINVRKVSEDPLSPNAVGRTSWWLTMEVLVVARDPTAPDRAPDSTVEAVHSLLFANRTLGGIALDLAVGPASYQPDPEVKEVCRATRQYRVLYQTTEESLAT